MGMYADIIVDISLDKLDKPFQYEIPASMEEKLEVGMCVIVPFGNGNRQLKGYVINITDKCNFDPARTKSILKIEENGVSIEDKLILLAGWIKKNYGGTMNQALKTVLPVKSKIKPQTHTRIVRLMTVEEINSLMGLCIKKKQTAKARLLSELMTQETIPREWVTGKLNISAATINSLEKEGAIKLEIIDSVRNPVKLNTGMEAGKILTQKQQEIVDDFINDYENGKRSTYLIHGVTGSGKTEVYLGMIEHIVGMGKQVIMLIPEIALTYQTLMRFYKRFGDRVSIMNSTLSAGEKYDQFERAKAGEIDIIIGPRSALFTPFRNLGMIIMDEEHEGSYKSETVPRFHTRETAIQVAKMYDASVVLGSATPSLESYFQAKNGSIKLYEIEERLNNSLPEVYTVDLREELRNGNKSIFSKKLQELITDRLNKNQQTMLFINRRGYAGFISCRACGQVIKCPHCDVSLSEHRGNVLMCHYCGYTEPKPSVCPQCKSKYISGFRAGTQQIEDKLKEMYPGIRVLRMDADTTKTKDSYENILSAFANHEADVLVGTQMIVKGHDFPFVTLVGVIAADLSLGTGDYRACEKTFQLLTQAVGRAGRGQIKGEAVIQTYQPDNYGVIFGAAQDYKSFYDEEILYREMMDYPPSAHMLAVMIQSKDEESAKKLGELLAGKIKPISIRLAKENIRVIGPSPAAIGKINDIFRFAFYIKCPKYDTLVRLKDYLENIIWELNLTKEMVTFDFDPVNTL